MGVTEYLAKKTKTKKFAMLIYNKNLSVCPLTTHLPIKLVPKNLNSNIINGALVGGASLDVEQFVKIIESIEL